MDPFRGTIGLVWDPGGGSFWAYPGVHSGPILGVISDLSWGSFWAHPGCHFGHILVVIILLSVSKTGSMRPPIMKVCERRKEASPSSSEAFNYETVKEGKKPPPPPLSLS